MGEKVMPWLIPVIQVLVMVASMVMTHLAAASKRKANSPQANMAASDARKGFEIVVEGKAEFVPKVYGRAKIGGVRVYHNVSGGYKHVTTNADDVFETGSTLVGGNYNKIKRDGDGVLYFEPQTYSALETGRLSQTISDAGKNEFLYFQQILCQGPIYNVIDIIIDDNRYFDDPSLGDYMVRNELTMFTNDVKSTEIEWKKTTAALRVNCYRAGGVADNIITANFSDRADAKFTGLAYASAIIRMDRDDPQFSGVPSLQFLVEGSLVKKVVNGVLATTAGYVDSSGNVYGNNPAWCLLDYLMDKQSGKGVDASEIDLASFETVAAICAQIVQTNAIVGGKIYKSTDGTRNTDFRNVPLYECNLITDPRKSIRENIESILETMGDARLVWSGGKYKLSLQYVQANTALNLATTITDDNLILDQSISIAWPQAIQRLNFATIRFHNETEEFKEDSVSWPPKVTTSYKRGVGGFLYSQAISGQNNDTAGGLLLNSYGVWEGSDNANLYYQFVVPRGTLSAYTLKYTADRSMTILLKDVATNATIHSGSASGVGVATATLAVGQLGSTVADKVYSVTITGTKGDPQRGIAAKLETSTNIIWTTRSVAYTSFIDVTLDSAIYDTMLLEDSGLKLELDMFSEGITDYYHALAKAEELVKTSRSAFVINFKYIVTNVYLEPGDYLKLQSDAAYLGSGTNPLYLRIESVKMAQDNSCEVVASRFDYTQLAWSTKPGQYIKPPNIYDSSIVGPAWVEYTPRAESLGNSSGTLNWAAVSQVDTYIVYMHTSDDVIDADGIPLFSEIGRVPYNVTTFVLPLLKSTSAFFGVKVSLNGRLSKMTYTDTTLPILLDNYTYSFAGLAFRYNSSQYSPNITTVNSISWSAFTVTINGTTVKNVSAGTASYVDKKIYIYYDPITNFVLSSTSINIANSGKILAEYSGGTNGSQQASNLNPPIHLYVKDTTGSTYTSKDLELTWDYDTNNDIKTDILASYYIEVLKLDNTIVFKSNVAYDSATRGGYYKITYALNQAWFGTATRNYVVKVYSVDTAGSLSSAASISVVNNIPAQVSISTPVAGILTIYLNVTTAAEPDVIGYQVYQSATSGFNPPAGTLVYDGPLSNISISVKDTTKYYYKIAAYDSFDKTNLNFSSQYEATANTSEAITWTIASGLVFTANQATKTVSWTAGSILKTGETVTRPIVSGSAVWSTGFIYAYYDSNDTVAPTVLKTTTSLSIAVKIGTYPIATYTGGDNTTIKGGTGDAFISGSQLIAGTVGATQIIAGSITGDLLNVNNAVITGTAQIADGIITDAKIGNTIQSINYNVANKTGWKLDKTGNIRTYGSIQILDSSGNVVLASGSNPTWNWDNITGTNIPADNATRNVFRGDWATATAYVSGDIVLDTWGYGWSCILEHTSSASILTPVYPVSNNTYWTLYAVKGVDAVSVVLSNDTHTLPAASDGTVAVGSYAGSGTTVQVFDGTREVIYDAVGTTNGTWKVVATPTNITVGTLTDSGNYLTVGVASGVAAGIDTASISYAITGKAFNGDAINITAQQSFSKSKAGVAGTPATYVTVTGEQAFKFATGSATPTSTSITLTAALTGGLTTYQWDYWNGTAWTTLSGTVNASTYSLAYNNAAFTANSLRVRCISGTAFDEITIVKLYDGATGVSAVSGYLTNETVAVATASDGTGAVYTSAGGTFKVFNGTTDVTTSTTFTTTGAVSGLTLTIGAATGVYSVAGTWTSDTASFTLTGVYSGTTITKVYKITKSKAGDSGDSVDIVFVRSATPPATPTASTGAPTAPITWYSEVTAANTAGGLANPLYSSTGFKAGSVGNYAWSAPVRIDGTAVAEVTVFIRSATAPVPTPTGGTYTFSATPVVVAPTAWSTSVPSGTNPVYTSRAVVSTSSSNTAAVAISGWSTPVISLQDGAQGPSALMTSSRAASFTATDGTLDASQADIVFTTQVSGVTSPTYVWTFSGFQTSPANSGSATQTITSAQFGTSKSAIITCTVSGVYVDKMTVVRLEKTTAAAGATVGAHNKVSQAGFANVSGGFSGKGFTSSTNNAYLGNSQYMNLSSNKNYCVSFLAWCSVGTVSFRVDLFPDTLPEYIVNVNATKTTYSYVFNSASTDMQNCILRFFSLITTGATVYITDIILQEGTNPAAWSPSFLDAVNLNNPMTPANITTYISGAAIDTAQIANLAVTTGKIANLAVDTLQIAGNAVTVPASAYTSGAQSLAFNEQQIQSLVVSCAGGGIRIDYGYTSDGYTFSQFNEYCYWLRGGKLNLYRDGILIKAGGMEFGSLAAAYVDYPGAGDHTYVLKYNLVVYANATGPGSLSHRYINALEIKR
jgi:hypothetical protein